MTISPKQIGKVYTHPDYAAGINAFALPPNGAMEQYRAMIFPQASAGATLVFPDPIDASVIFGVDFINTGAQSLTVSGMASFSTTVDAGSTVRIVWGGTKWSIAAAPVAVKAWTQTDAYTAGELVFLDSNITSNNYWTKQLVMPNAAIPAGTAFAWGTTGQTWAPVLPSDLTWKGVYAANTAYPAWSVVSSPFSGKLWGATTTLAAPADPSTEPAPPYWQHLDVLHIDAFSGATNNLAGTSGAVPQPAQYDLNKVLGGNGAWKDHIPAWQSNIYYRTGNIVTNGTSIYRRGATSGLSGATFDAAEKAWWVEIGGSSQVATLIDSSGGVQTIALGAATGNGTLKFFANANIGATATLTVPAGHMLNGVTDGTFLFSAYPNGTQFIATDYKAGEWSVAVDGAATNITLHRAYFRLNAGAGQVGNGQQQLSTPAITYDPNSLRVGNTIVIKQAGAYRIDMMASFGQGGSESATNSTVDIRVNGTSVAVGADHPFVSGAAASGNWPANASAYWEGPLAVGDVVTFWNSETGAIGNGTAYQVHCGVSQQPSQQTVLAGMVTATPLAASVRVTPTAAWTTTSTAFTLDPGATYTVPASHAGRVRIDAQVSIANSSDADYYAIAAIFKNGVVLADSYMPMWARQSVNYRTDTSTNFEVNVVAGDVLELRVKHVSGAVQVGPPPADGNYISGGTFFSITPLPTSTVAMVNGVTSFVQVSGLASTTPTAGAPIRFANVVEGSIPYNAATGNFTLEANVTYELHAEVRFLTNNADCQWTDTSGNPLVANSKVGMAGGSETASTVIYTPSVSKQVQYRIIANNSSTMDTTYASAYVKQLGASPALVSTAVNDQAASGYFDVGAMRIQWGSGAAGVNTVVTFPAAFANAAYTFTASANTPAAANRLNVVMPLTKTATTCTVQHNYVTGGTVNGATGETFSWFAIGLKP